LIHPCKQNSNTESEINTEVLDGDMVFNHMIAHLDIAFYIWFCLPSGLGLQRVVAIMTGKTSVGSCKTKKPVPSL